MLCTECELMLSQWEMPFSEKVYHPWCNREAAQITYGSWMLKFATSVSWRALTWYMDYSSVRDTYTESAKAVIAAALQTWKRFLFAEIPNPQEYQQHLILLDSIENATHLERLPPNFNRYLTRGIEINIAHCDDHPLYIYTKMGKVVLLGFLGITHHRQWVGTKLCVKDGRIDGNITIPSQFGEYLIDRAGCVQQKYAEISERQKENITKTYEADLDRAAASETLRMMAKDVELFGADRVFARDSEHSKERLK